MKILNKENIPFLSVFLSVFLLLFVIQLDNYLLFHAIAEFFSISIAWVLFIIVWNGRSYVKGNFLLLYGIAYLFIGLLDSLHTLGYKGMGIFTDYDFYANQFWIAGRFLESLTLFSGAFFISRKMKASVYTLFVLYGAITGFLIYSILFSDLFPICFIEGEGQTRFKLISEVVIIIILAATLFLFIKNRRSFKNETFLYMILSILFTILSEFAFIFYIDNYGFSNMVGHFSKILSFYFLYRAVIKISIKDPYESIFKELKDANQMKTHLFSIISHDLRGPLSGVTAAVKSLEENYELLDVDTKKAFLSESRKSLENTEFLLNNLLYWSRSEMKGHKLTRVSCNIEPLLNESLQELHSYFLLKAIHVKHQADQDVYIDVDRETFKVVIRNILSNAIKFSEKSSEIKISLKKKKGNAVIQIQDYGRGMDMQSVMLDKRVNTSTSGTAGEKGTGLGLYMIKKYTEENGGVLEIRSEQGKGTTVLLTFRIRVS